MEISIGNNHLAQVARWQHVLEWLAAERARLESEHAHVVAAGARVQGEMLTFLRDVYGVDPAAPLRVDSERGVLVVPDPAPSVAEPAEPVADAPVADAPTPAEPSVPAPDEPTPASE